ncbi:MAG: hypothetical protein R3339_05895 [Thermodesulfobacteriota bacterium]|nr:hypothetical protein [Thermodesulfobacteriota bacterium]
MSRVEEKIGTKIVFLIAAIVLSGCAHMVKTDLDTYLENKEEFKGKQVILKTDLQDLSERYDMYRRKRVELTAPVTYSGSWKFWTWHIILDDGENMIRAYESEYRIYADRRAVYLLWSALREKGSVTIQGRVEKQGIELNRIYYKDYAINTNVKMDRNLYFYY